MTEQDAKKKGCPLYGISMIMLIAADKIDQIKVPDPDNVGCCIASDCAMWRWEYDGDGQQCGWGYCGLANKP